MDNVCSDKQGFMLCTDDCVSRTKGHKVTSSAGEKKKNKCSLLDDTWRQSSPPTTVTVIQIPRGRGEVLKF